MLWLSCLTAVGAAVAGDVPNAARFAVQRRARSRSPRCSSTSCRSISRDGSTSRQSNRFRAVERSRGGESAFVLSSALARRRTWALGVAVTGVTAIDYLHVRDRAHWPVDVLVGTVVGVAGAFASTAVARTLRANPAHLTRRVRSFRSAVVC